MDKQRPNIKLSGMAGIGILAFVVLTFLIAPLIGSGFSEPGQFYLSETGQKILMELRLPRVVFAFLVGFSLAMIGVVFQALLQKYVR